MTLRYRTSAFIGILFLTFAHTSLAAQINVAVASNALAAIKVISIEFEKQTDNSISISSGSTGKLYAQIINGAPFDIFLAANESEPQKLEESGLTISGSRFTYALGKLVAWSPDASLLKAADIKRSLLSTSVQRIAIANPKTAPYGVAAQQVLEKIGVWELLQGKIIRGENVSQTFQFAMSNNAQIAFVAKSQILHSTDKSSLWEVPEKFYTPIKQQAVLLLRAKQKPAAEEFLTFLKNDRAKDILIEQFGYGVESSGASH